MTVTDEAVEKIKEMITSGVLSPGERLPKEEELARSLGVSRNSLREAVRALSLVRVLDVRRGDGTYVTSLSSALLLDAVSFVVECHRDDSLLDFLEVLRVLEVHAVGVVACRATDHEISMLRRSLDELVPDSAPAEIVALTHEVHRMISSLCGNPVLTGLLDAIFGLINRERTWRDVTDSHTLAGLLADYEALVEAIERRSSELAAAWVHVYIAEMEKWLFRLGSRSESTRDAEVSPCST